MRRKQRAILSLAAAASVALAVAGCSTAGTPGAGATVTASAASSAPSAAPADTASGQSSAPGEAWALDFHGSADRITAAGLEILTAEGTAEHYHAHLDIFVNGSPVPVPADIGIAVNDAGQATGISALHTHDSTGVLHIEAATAGQKFTLGQALKEWGVLGPDGSIGGQSGTGSHGWHAYVNGARISGDATALKLAAHQEIALVYGTDPTTVPRSYDFPAGL